MVAGVAKKRKPTVNALPPLKENISVRGAAQAASHEELAELRLLVLRTEVSTQRRLTPVHSSGFGAVIVATATTRWRCRAASLSTAVAMQPWVPVMSSTLTDQPVLV